MKIPENREWRRVNVNIPVEVKLLSAPGVTFSGRLVNLNPDGVCFTVPDSIFSGHDVALSFELAGEGALRLRCKIIWAATLDKAGERCAGGKLHGVQTRERDKFLRFYHLKVMSVLGG